MAYINQGEDANARAGKEAIYAGLQQAGQYANRAIESRAFDRCISDARDLREQVAQAVKIADSILERISGPLADDTCDQESNSKDAANGGALGELQRVQGSALSSLGDLRRTLEQIGKYV